MLPASRSSLAAAAIAWLPGLPLRFPPKKPVPASSRPCILLWMRRPSPPGKLLLQPEFNNHLGAPVQPSSAKSNATSDRRAFLRRATHGLAVLFAALLGIPALAYLLDPRNRPAPDSEFKTVA